MFVGGCLFVSALLGAALKSWGSFWVMLIVMIVGSSGALGTLTHPDVYRLGVLWTGT